jgi:hypothetical protein
LGRKKIINLQRQIDYISWNYIAFVLKTWIFKTLGFKIEKDEEIFILFLVHNLFYVKRANPSSLYFSLGLYETHIISLNFQVFVSLNFPNICLKPRFFTCYVWVCCCWWWK